MMDLKDIIKWFIPCFHILLIKTKLKRYFSVTFICLFLFFNSCPRAEAKEFSVSALKVNRLDSFNFRSNQTKYLNINQRDQNFLGNNLRASESSQARAVIDTARTFGRPFMKKIISAIIPLAFQIGAASTWAVVAAIVGVKTLAVTLIILKLLLVAGAAKFGSFFFHKTEHQGWSPPSPHQKEIHVHIHNSPHGGGHHHEYDWNRDGATIASETKTLTLDPMAGPQTIVTPYGNYVKVGPTPNVRKR